MTYDPALVNTAACRSRISFIDGDKGILRYRGYPIEQLAEQSSFLETAWLVLEGELPTRVQLKAFTRAIHDHRVPPARLAGLFDGLADDPHPMGALIAAFAALGTFYPEARDIQDPAIRRTQMYRIIGQTPALAAYAARARKGEPIVPPAEGLTFAGKRQRRRTFRLRGRQRRIVGECPEQRRDNVTGLHGRRRAQGTHCDYRADAPPVD